MLGIGGGGSQRPAQQRGPMQPGQQQQHMEMQNRYSWVWGMYFRILGIDKYCVKIRQWPAAVLTIYALLITERDNLAAFWCNATGTLSTFPQFEDGNQSVCHQQWE